MNTPTTTTTNTVCHNRISQVWLQSNDTLFIDIESDSNFELEDMEELIDSAKRLGSGRRLKNIINVGRFTIPDHSARDYSASEEGSRYKLADAFVIQSQTQKFVGNFYLRFNKPTVPTRFFDCVEKAEAWLLGLHPTVD